MGSKFSVPEGKSAGPSQTQDSAHDVKQNPALDQAYVIQRFLPDNVVPPGYTRMNKMKSMNGYEVFSFHGSLVSDTNLISVYKNHQCIFTVCYSGGAPQIEFVTEKHLWMDNESEQGVRVYDLENGQSIPIQWNPITHTNATVTNTTSDSKEMSSAYTNPTRPSEVIPAHNGSSRIKFFPDSYVFQQGESKTSSVPHSFLMNYGGCDTHFKVMHHEDFTSLGLMKVIVEETRAVVSRVDFASDSKVNRSELPRSPRHFFRYSPTKVLCFISDRNSTQIKNGVIVGSSIRMVSASIGSLRNTGSDFSVHPSPDKNHVLIVTHGSIFGEGYHILSHNNDDNWIVPRTNDQFSLADGSQFGGWYLGNFFGLIRNNNIHTTYAVHDAKITSIATTSLLGQSIIMDDGGAIVPKLGESKKQTAAASENGTPQVSLVREVFMTCYSLFDQRALTLNALKETAVIKDNILPRDLLNIVLGYALPNLSMFAHRRPQKTASTATAAYTENDGLDKPHKSKK